MRETEPGTRFMPPLRGAAAALLLVVAAHGQTPVEVPEAEFRFTRLQYGESGFDSGFRGFRGWRSWQVDFPEAEIHFRRAVERLTRVEFGEPGFVHLQDDTLFNYPWLYAVEVGQWYLDETEAARLREYLLRGGFLMVDDFHGSREWQGFVSSMSRVFPDRPIVEIE